MDNFFIFFNFNFEEWEKENLKGFILFKFLLAFVFYGDLIFAFNKFEISVFDYLKLIMNAHGHNDIFMSYTHFGQDERSSI